MQVFIASLACLLSPYLRNYILIAIIPAHSLPFLSISLFNQQNPISVYT
jgi:hypothetical protein